MDVIVGGGVVGLSVAWRTARAGRAVTVVDPAPGRGASYAAAGMLAPVSEVTYTEAPLLRLGVASLRRWPAFAAELAADAGLPAGTGPAAGKGPASSVESGAGPGFAEVRGLDLRADGTLDVAFGADDLAALDELAAYMEKLGLPVERLTGRECRRLEPMLAPSVRGGLLAPGDAWVDPRRVTAALLAALERLDVPVVRARATGLLYEGGRVAGVRLAPPASEDGPDLRRATGPDTTGPDAAGPDAAAREVLPHEVRGERVVLAAGAWSSELAEVPVRPVKGQIMRLRSPQPLLSRCVRGSVHGSSVYLVPRGDGELVVGATQEEMGFDTRVTAGGLYELLRDARELVPGVTELEVADVVAGLRPGTPDNLPLIGPGRTPGLAYATGHHRGGVLLAPLTTAILLGEESELAALCAPGRFREIS
ncbi:glycine oxidase [Nonomuraea thailandensis]|uniref:Glycine oxidase n=1 Tax=Nonomuraea thailandensis TaxID=1188745 RepID=A0A9X2GIM0_9ACTN|nr:FAD-dependent oxidoreductase [Nonomuraea thailandensis]MCP2359556.1 glycine oxidase [Nonomuraea thailandensis]